MMDKIKKLIELLDNIDLKLYFKEVEEYDVDDDDGDDGNYLAYNVGYIGDHPTSEIIEDIACDLFIMKSGKPNYEVISEFEKFCNRKYIIRPGEADSFGWLTGIIRRTEDGIIVHCFG